MASALSETTFVTGPWLYHILVVTIGRQISIPP